MGSRNSVFIFVLNIFFYKYIFLDIGTECYIRIPLMNVSHYRFFFLSRQLRLIQIGYVHDGQFIFSYLVR